MSWADYLADDSIRDALAMSDVDASRLGRPEMIETLERLAGRARERTGAATAKATAEIRMFRNLDWRGVSS